MGGDKKGSGLGTTLVLALVIVVLSVLLGVGLANYGDRLPLLGPLFVEGPGPGPPPAQSWSRASRSWTSSRPYAGPNPW